MLKAEDFVRDLLTILFAQYRLILAVTGLVFAAALAVAFFWPPVYAVQGSILVKGKKLEKSPEALEYTQIKMTEVSREDLTSESEILTSPEVVRAVVLSLREQGLAYTEAPLDDEALKSAIGHIRNEVKTKILPNSNILEVSYHSGDPRMALVTLQQLLDEYVRQRMSVFTPPQMTQFFSGQVDRYTREMREQEEELLALAEAAGSPDASREIANNLTLKMELERHLYETRGLWLDRKKVTDYLQQALEDKEIRFFSSVESLPITQLGGKLQELVVERGKLLRVYHPESSRIAHVNEQIASLNRTLRREVAGYTRAKLAELEEKITAIEQRNRELYRNSLTFQRIQRDISLQAHSYETFAKRLEEARINTSSDANTLFSISILSRPFLPGSPVFPNKKRLIPLGLLAGLITGGCLGFFREYLDHSLKRPEDVHRHLGLTTLFSIPHWEEQ
jgi:uncharacterized protein involved in exopolysaccharide biosynthesis